MHGRLPIMIAVTLSLTFGCTSVPSKQLGVAPSLLRGNPPQVRERLLTHIPIGTPRVDAERHLKSLGLELTPQSELGSETPDSIHCRHTEKKGLFGEATWLIQIDCLDGAVADIFCEQIAIELW